MPSAIGDSPNVVVPYSGGGGGTVLEHEYGAVLLSCLLTGSPIAELGEDATPVLVAFQASRFSPVDDLVVTGRAADGAARRVSIGVRRAPALTESEDASAHLLAPYVRTVVERWEEVHAGRWRLALAVASPNTAVKQLRELALMANTQLDGPQAFRARAAQASKEVTTRLGHFDALISKAIVIASKTVAAVDSYRANELAWRVLTCLRIVELRLEGVEQTDRAHAVGRLQRLTRDKTPAAAEAVYSRLSWLSHKYAPAGAEAAEWMVRRELSGMPLERSPVRPRAWACLDSLAQTLRDHTGTRLEHGNQRFELKRPEELAALEGAVADCAARGAALVVRGEPDVGKSALTLRAARLMAEAGAAVTVLSLADLPPRTVEVERLLDGPLADVLGSTAVGTHRLLVIDGAEAVLHGHRNLLIDLAIAALRIGITVVPVTRDDAVSGVAEALREAFIAAELTPDVHEHVVAGLSAREVDSLVGSFGLLARLRDDPRAVWLLRRPGLVDLLLRADAVTALPAGPLDEAHVFHVLWRRLVRCDETVTPHGPSPDGRERALITLARRELLPDAGPVPEADALPSLRSDGLLRSTTAAGEWAWSRADAFATDLVRDLALARLFLGEGWEILERASAPRTALRAARLACQAVLVEAGSETESARARLQEVFDELAAHHGQRWAELPTEALLTLGTARAALTRAWSRMQAQHQAGLRMLLRVARQRFIHGSVGQAEILATVIELVFVEHLETLKSDWHGPNSLGEQIRTIGRAYLRALVFDDVDPMVLRQRVRDQLVETMGPDGPDESTLEDLATLGPDLDERVQQLLMALADQGGAYLAPAVESPWAGLAMARNRPQLLLSLTEAYYLPANESGYGGRLFGRGMGVRDHERGGGLGRPPVSWDRGPFMILLYSIPTEALALINRMLDRATARQDARPTTATQRAADGPTALEISLPGVGMRRCTGNAWAWRWYRGAMDGPMPCISALLAVEVWADQRLSEGRPLGEVVEALLRECHNVAMPGLVAGLLTRHIEHANTLLDDWLVDPELWLYDDWRTGTEGRIDFPLAKSPGLAHLERRASGFPEACTALAQQAAESGDADRQAFLEEIGRRLMEAAEDLAARYPETDKVALLEGFAQRAALLGAPQPMELEDRISADAPHSEDFGIARASAPAPEMRLLDLYADCPNRDADVASLLDDIAIARSLTELSYTPERADAVGAVAASAIVAHAHATTDIPEPELAWAVELLLNAAAHSSAERDNDLVILSPRSVLRSAAVGIASALLPPVQQLAVDNALVEAAIVFCTSSGSEELRGAFARTIGDLWWSPCTASKLSNGCIHRTVWDAITNGLRDSRLGPYDQHAGQRTIEPLDGPFEQTLLAVPDQSLMVNRLTAPLAAAVLAARSGCCISTDAASLREVLYATYRRGALHWTHKGYFDTMYHRERRQVVRVLIEESASGNPQPLVATLHEFAVDEQALSQLLRDANYVFTTHHELRTAMLPIWRVIMSTGLDELKTHSPSRQRRHYRDVIGHLLPTPQLDPGIAEFGRQLELARLDWVDPDQIADLIERWLPFARYLPEAADSLVELIRCADPHWQASTGMDWLYQLVSGAANTLAGRCWHLSSWLGEIRRGGLMSDTAPGRWHLIVDELAAAGDNKAVALQREEE